MLGNDAHYTLVGFKEMCITTPKNPPVVEELPTVSIRDLVADDLIAKSSEEKPSEKKEKPVEESAAPPSDEPLISLDEFINGTVPHGDKVDSSPQHNGSVSSHSTESSPNGVKPPRIKRRYFQHTIELAPANPEIPISAAVPPGKDPQISSSETTATKYVPPQKRTTSDHHVKSPPVDPELSPLPASSPATVTPARRKKSRKPKSENGTRRAFQSTCAIDMEVMKYGGAIDDLTTAFAGAAVTTTKGGGQKTMDEGVHKANGAGSHNFESIELGMSN